MAEFMDCDHVRVPRRPIYRGRTADAIVGYVTDGLKALGAYAAEKEITVSIEMHGSFTDPDSAMEVIEGVNLPNVGFVFNSQFIGCDAGSIDPALFACRSAHYRGAYTPSRRTRDVRSLSADVPMAGSYRFLRLHIQ